MVKKILKAVLTVILIGIILFIALVLVFRFSRNADKKEQSQRYEQFQSERGPRLTIPDSLLGDELKLNEIRYLATHNSYHRQAGPLQLALLNLFEPGEAEKLRYSHLDFYSQLEIGVRSFELDIRRYRSGKIENIHVPLVDNRGHSPVFRAALKEMKLWSDRNPGHVPVIVIMEVKDDWRFLDPGLKRWDATGLFEVEGVIKEVVGNRLISPADIKGDSASVREAVTGGVWPALGETRGSFIFLFHQSDADYFNAEYLDNPDRVCFYMDEPDSPEASFILRNEPESEDIKSLIKQGFIIRTRADADCEADAERRNKAIASGAQIVSTEYPDGYASAAGNGIGWQELLDRYIY